MVFYGVKGARSRWCPACVQKTVYWDLVDAYEKMIEQNVVEIVTGTRGVEYTMSKLYENETGDRENNR